MEDLNRELTVNFIQKLHTEMFQKQKFIRTLITGKIAFTVGLFTAGNIDINNASFHWLFLFIPFLITIYDHYILITYYSVVKIGSFLRDHSCEIERIWEESVSRERKKTLLSIYISFGASFVITLATIWFIYHQKKLISNIGSYIFWFVIVGICWVLNFYFAYKKIMNLDESNQKENLNKVQNE
jgi:hypothetical protein